MTRRELRARLVYLSEALEAGDYGVANSIALDLVDELGGTTVRAARCPECRLALWPGQVAKHRSVVHGVDPYAEAA